MSAAVRVEPLGIVVHVELGESLMAAAERAGYQWPTICRGNAQCNRCVVRVIDGSGLEPYSATELAGLRAVRWRGIAEDHAERLACQLRVTGAAVVEKRGVRLREAAAGTEVGDEPSERRVGDERGST